MPRRPRRCVHHPFSNDIDDAQLACLTLLRLPALRCLNFLIIQGFLERRRSGQRRYRCGPRERLWGYICKRNHGAIMLVDCMAVIVEHKFGPYRGPAFGSVGKNRDLPSRPRFYASATCGFVAENRGVLGGFRFFPALPEIGHFFSDTQRLRASSQESRVKDN